MTADALDPLRQALDRAAEAGRRVPIWWRDDDAVRATPALDRLLALAERHDLPIVLAVIPAALDASLPARLLSTPRARVAVHGWSHANHAPTGAKPAEFGPHRPLGRMLDDARRGRERLAEAFGVRALSLFVPPWNRIDPDLAARLGEAGYRGWSGFGSSAPGTGGRLDTHLDPIAWRTTRSLATPDQLVAGLSRLVESVPPVPDPLGLLTHHLVADEAVWRFTEELLALLAAHPAVHWSSPDDLLPLSTNRTGSDTLSGSDTDPGGTG